MITENKKIQLNNEVVIDINIFLKEIHLNISKNDLNSILFMNSAFFNKEQWKNIISLLNSMIDDIYPIQYITYDYSGIGDSSYAPHKIDIDDFILEFKSIINLLKLDKIHIFSMSLGTWVGLNVFLNEPKYISSYTGYGVLSPLSPKFDLLRKERFNKMQRSLIELSHLKKYKIHEDNWDQIMNAFYIPIFFPEFELNESDRIQHRMNNMLQKMLFPYVKGNYIEMFYDYYQYITETMFKEREKTLNLISCANSNIPVLIMNGKLDKITPYEMCLDLSQRLKNSQHFLFDKLGHGSIILGKGIDEILNEYLRFLYSKNLLKKKLL